MQFQIRNRWSGEVQVTAEIECAEGTAYSIKLGLAVKWAIKSRADLGGADLGGADLGGANLGGANLGGANLRGANLGGANLGGANLGGADLGRANLGRADLGRANLGGANLGGADLGGANLGGADLGGADLGGAKNIPDHARLGLGSLTLKQFRDDIVPALLMATGKTIPDVLATGCWDCHDWSNCPMHAVFGVGTTESVPPLWRPYAEVFVRLFDSNQLPKPEA